MADRILITGVAGFIGSNLADDLLRRGYDVVGIDNLAYGVMEQVPKEIEFHKLDVRSKDIYPVFEGIDYVYHLAAKNCISDCQHDPLETSDINVTGTVNVFEAARRANVKKVIYAESSALYEGSSNLPSRECDVRPESFYAISKLCGMEFAKAYERYFDLNTTALRYFCVYGPRQDYRRTIPPVMSAFIINLLKKKRPTIYGTGLKKRDFIYVDDVNNFHVMCMNDRRTDHRVFNLGSGDNYSVKDIYEIISNLLNINQDPIYKEDLPGEAQETLADISEAKSLGWSPKIDIREGLHRAITYIKDEVIAHV